MSYKAGDRHGPLWHLTANQLQTLIKCEEERLKQKIPVAGTDRRKGRRANAVTKRDLVSAAQNANLGRPVRGVRRTTAQYGGGDVSSETAVAKAVGLEFSLPPDVFVAGPEPPEILGPEDLIWNTAIGMRAAVYKGYSNTAATTAVIVRFNSPEAMEAWKKSRNNIGVVPIEWPDLRVKISRPENVTISRWSSEAGNVGVLVFEGHWHLSIDDIAVRGGVAGAKIAEKIVTYVARPRTMEGRLENHYMWRLIKDSKWIEVTVLPLLYIPSVKVM